MHKIGYWASLHFPAVGHCFTPANLARQVRWRQILNERGGALGLRRQSSTRTPEHAHLFYLAPRATEAAHQMRALTELMNQLSVR